MKPVHQESLAIGAMLAAAILFGLWVLPLGIGAPSASQGVGLSARFMPQLATLGIVLALAWGLYGSLTGTAPAVKAGGDQGGHARKPIGAVAICLVFAVIGFELAGFYVGGVCMAVLLTVLLGERRLPVIVLFPTLLLATIYLLFEFALNVRLPKLGLIPGLQV